MGYKLNDICYNLVSIRKYLSKLNIDRRVAEQSVNRKQEASKLYNKAQTYIDLINAMIEKLELGQEEVRLDNELVKKNKEK